VRALLWSVRRQISALGWPGVLGLTLVAFSGVFLASALLPMEARVQEAKDDVEALRSRLQAAPSAAGSSVSGDRLSNFYAFFPALSSAPDWLQRVFGLAEAQGLRLETGEYKLTREKDLKLARYELNLPLRGGYPQIRAFVSQVLADVPASSLDEISMKREDPGLSTVEARIKLSLYLGGEKAP
jgi:hypothetical protein